MLAPHVAVLDEWEREKEWGLRRLVVAKLGAEEGPGLAAQRGAGGG